MRKFFLIVAVVLGSKGFALLPPLAQSIKEIKAIVGDKRLYNSFEPGEVIQDIIRLEEGYLILTTHYEMVVGVRYNHSTSARVGPARFQLEFHNPRRIPNGHRS